MKYKIWIALEFIHEMWEINELILFDIERETNMIFSECFTNPSSDHCYNMTFHSRLTKKKVRRLLSKKLSPKVNKKKDPI